MSSLLQAAIEQLTVGERSVVLSESLSCERLFDTEGETMSRAMRYARQRKILVGGSGLRVVFLMCRELFEIERCVD